MTREEIRKAVLEDKEMVLFDGRWFYSRVGPDHIYSDCRDGCCRDDMTVELFNAYLDDMHEDDVASAKIV